MKMFLARFGGLLLVLGSVFGGVGVATAVEVPQLSSVVHTQNGGTSSDAAEKALRTTVSKDLSKNQYALDGGGYVNGNDVISPEGNINNAIYSQLSSDGKGKFASDLVSVTKKYTDPKVEDYNASLAKSNGVDEKTASNWFKDLKSRSGIGSRILTDILKGSINADLVTGAAWFKPFSSPLSALLGFFCIVVVSLLSLRCILDLTAITIPAFQSLADNVEGGNGGSAGGGNSRRVKIISHAARTAIKEQDSKNPVWNYFTKSAVEYIVLLIAIVFLCFNYMWEIAGMVLDGGFSLV